MVFGKWLSGVAVRTKSRRPSRRRPSLTIPVAAEVCETRQLLAARVLLTDGVVSRTGNAKADTFDVSYVNNQQQIKVTHRQGSVTNTQIFAASDVTRITFDGMDGNDKFTNNTTIASEANGGKGNDTLKGGSGDD